MYSPTLGRFLQTDPIGYGDGMNMYNYVGGDPVNGRDPSGTVGVCNPNHSGGDAGCNLIVVTGTGSNGASIGGGFDIGSAVPILWGLSYFLDDEIVVTGTKPQKQGPPNPLCSILGAIPGGRLRLSGDAAFGLGSVIGLGGGASIEDNGRITFEGSGIIGPGIGGIAGAGISVHSDSVKEGWSGSPTFILAAQYIVGGNYTNSRGSENGSVSLGVGPKVGALVAYAHNINYANTLTNLNCPAGK